ncbi:hypothetical protein AW736_11970 [Termitidicoccus mucosus]|uniref:Uncharacterized protein n=1 Tax=Termitidicoccus mucosus TaxID=1184151 RepID=A0A178IJ47_9BACT|nr:hypothetical protein AW736_11970 [Opitutaceae bacterium TSB47]
MLDDELQLHALLQTQVKTMEERIGKRHRARGKLPNNAIIITARRMAKIAWQMLHEKRDYMPAPPPGKPLSPAAPEES